MQQGWHREESAFIYQRDQNDYLGSASEGCSGRYTEKMYVRIVSNLHIYLNACYETY